jgi:uncharacterized protein
MIPEEAQIIDGYGPGMFRVRGTVYEGARIVLPYATMAWPVATVADISLDSLAGVTGASPAVEVLLIGTGGKMEMLPRGLKQQIKQQSGISVEAMDTGAACRTYNVLMAEGRRVALAALPV